MSFGYGVGDFITTGQFAWSLYKTCSGAPESFSNISNEVLSLHAVLKQIEEAIPSQSLSLSELHRLNAVTRGCNGVLGDLQKLVAKYDRLGSKSRRTWDRFKFGQEDTQELRSRLTSNILLLNTFWSTCQYTVARKLERYREDFENEKDTASIFTVETINSISMEDRQTWRDIRKGLEDVGITVAAFDNNREFILQWFKEMFNTDASAGPCTSGVDNTEKAVPTSESTTLDSLGNSSSHRESSSSGTSTISGGTRSSDVPILLPVARKTDSLASPLSSPGSEEGFELDRSVCAKPDLLLSPANDSITCRQAKPLPLLPTRASCPNRMDARPRRHHAVSMPWQMPMESFNSLFAFRPFDQGIDFELRSPTGDTQLHAAAAAGHSALVQLLLDNGADSKATNFKGDTPLHIAAAGGHHVAVAVFLSKSCDIEAKNRHGQTPLLCAAHVGRMTVDLLLKGGANFQAKDKYFHTALHYAVCSGNNSVVQTLLENGADLDANDEFDCRAGHYASLYGPSRKDTLETLLRYLPKTKSPLPPLPLRAKGMGTWKDSPILQELIKTAAEAKDDHGSPVLIASIITGRRLITSALLNASVDTETIDNQGLTALHYAAHQGFEEGIDILLSAGADIAARTKARKLLDSPAKASLDEFYYLRKMIFPDMVLLVPSLEQIPHWHLTPLHIASIKGRVEIIRRLLAAGANVQAMAGEGMLPLHSAAAQGHPNAVKLLLDGKAPINAVDARNRTALHLAAINGHEETVMLLLGRGAAIEKDVIDEVESKGKVEILGLLREGLITRPGSFIR
ncbi:MAG: hypothetical protein MMC33_004939 [Icmadophila ericetorum]|nr:hypothetical protein [Icmadophila ericetorum]